MATLLQLPDGRLALQTENGPQAVQISRCFPWTAPRQFLSLRNDDGDELLLVKTLSDLDPDSRELLETEIIRGAGTFQIESIQSLKKEIELRCWEVTTRQGPRSFQTELDEWPRELPDGTFLVEDLFGDLYVIPVLDQLDATSRKCFWPLIG